MLIVVSPAKKLNMDPVAAPFTLPKLQDEANELAVVARKLSALKLRKLMGISDSLAQLNKDRFAKFEDLSTPENAKQAALIFAGDTYTGLDATSFEPDEMDYAQDHLRILSGLYGLLRPRDLIQPYRLEMGSRLKTKRGKSLYEFWGDRVAEELNQAARDCGSDTVVNCASVEYFTAADRPALAPRVITPVFMEDKPAGPKIVSFFAKQARGAMARFLITRRITDPEGILDFDTGGYCYRPEMSSSTRPVFLRADVS